MPEAARVNEVPARHGIDWLKEAFELFRRAPIAWIGLCAGWIVIWFGLAILPLIGPVLANLLQPVFFGSFAIAAYKQSAGEPIAMGELFSGFRRNVRALVNIGILMMLAQLASAFLMRALGMPSWPEDEPFDMIAYAEMLRPHFWILAAGLGVLALASGILWFAPQLIVFHGMSAGHAVRWSVYATLANIGAMSVYGLMLIPLFLLCSVTLGLATIVVVPLVAISTYTGYRDIFERVPAEN
jgi:uncharacterized membrane protein